MPFLALLLQYSPMIFGLIQTAETVATTMATKPSGAAKLAAVTSAVVQSAPAIGALVQASPDHSNHLQDYISGSVAVMNSLNAWAKQQASPPDAPVVA
jgi:hypothetical protein